MPGRSVVTSVATFMVVAALAAPTAVAAEGSSSDASTLPAGVAVAAPADAPSTDDVVAVVASPTTGAIDVVRYSVADGVDPTEVAAVLDAHPDVVVAEQDGTWTPDGDLDPSVYAGDPGRTLQWQLDAVGAPSLWNRAGDAAVVAVIDTGVDADHPDLAGLVLPGWDFVSDTPTSTDRSYHGTFVSSMITAHRGNGVGVAPTVEDLRILPATVCAPSCSYGDIAEAIVWAMDQGVDVINMSLGGPDVSDVMQVVIDAARAEGILVVASAGNSGDKGNPVNYPAALDGVIGVGATAEGDVATSWASFGDWVDVAAPGQAVVGLTPNTTSLSSGSGTSFSAPMVSAALALVRNAAPDLTVSQIESLLVDSARDVHTAGWDPRTGHGVLDMVALLAATDLLVPPPPSAPPSPPPAPARFDDVDPGAFYSSSVDWARTRGLTTGVGGQNVFLPHREITRGEAMTLLWRIAGEPVAPASGFDDVPAGPRSTPVPSGGPASRASRPGSAVGTSSSPDATSRGPSS